jgi:hypothetical protein
LRKPIALASAAVMAGVFLVGCGGGVHGVGRANCTVEEFGGINVKQHIHGSGRVVAVPWLMTSIGKEFGTPDFDHPSVDLGDGGDTVVRGHVSPQGKPSRPFVCGFDLKGGS